MENTSGFYKKNEDGTWLYAKNEVNAPNYSLSREENQSENKHGWEWHESAPSEYLEWIESEKNKIIMPKY